MKVTALVNDLFWLIQELHILYRYNTLSNDVSIALSRLNATYTHSNNLQLNNVSHSGLSRPSMVQTNDLLYKTDRPRQPFLKPRFLKRNLKIPTIE